MDTHIVRLGQLAVASLLLSVFCAIGCTTWKASLDHPTATNVVGSSVSRMSADLQRILLLQAVHNLNADFNRIHDSPEWNKHLQLEAIQNLLNQPNNVPPDKATRERLMQIASRFDAIANNSDFRVIYELPSFRTVQAALPEFAIDPVVRQGRIIAANLILLSEELDGFSYGAGWKTFLKLDRLTELTRSPQALTRADRNALIEILTQFKKIKEGPEYVAIATAAGFDGAVRGLEHLVNDLRTDTQQTVQPDSETPRGLDPKRYHVVELINGESIVIDRASGNRVPELRQPFESSQRRVDGQHGTGQPLDRAELGALPEPPTPTTTISDRVASSSQPGRPTRPVVPAAGTDGLEPPGVPLPSTSNPSVKPIGVNSQPKSPSRPADSASGPVNLKFASEASGTDAIQTERSLPQAERPPNLDASPSSTPASDQTAVNVQFVSTFPSTTKRDPAGAHSQSRPRSAPEPAAPNGARLNTPSTSLTELPTAVTKSSHDLVPLSDKLRYVRDVKKELRDHIDELNNVIREVNDDARVRVETIEPIPAYRPGRRLVTVWTRRSFSRAELVEHIAALQTQMEQADIEIQPSDAEPPADQQRQAELIQRIEKALRTLYEATGAQ